MMVMMMMMMMLLQLHYEFAFVVIFDCEDGHEAVGVADDGDGEHVMLVRSDVSGLIVRMMMSAD